MNTATRVPIPCFSPANSWSSDFSSGCWFLEWITLKCSQCPFFSKWFLGVPQLRCTGANEPTGISSLNYSKMGPYFLFLFPYLQESIALLGCIQATTRIRRCISDWQPPQIYQTRAITVTALRCSLAGKRSIAPALGFRRQPFSSGGLAIVVWQEVEAVCEGKKRLPLTVPEHLGFFGFPWMTNALTPRATDRPRAGFYSWLLRCFWLVLFSKVVRGRGRLLYAFHTAE